MSGGVLGAAAKLGQGLFGNPGELAVRHSFIGRKMASWKYFLNNGLASELFL